MDVINKQAEEIVNLLRDLQERSKELSCLYRIEDLLNDGNASLESLLKGVVDIIPSGWQYPELCEAKITYSDETYASKSYAETPYKQCIDILLQEKNVGQLCVAYRNEIPRTAGRYFLDEENKLLKTIADRLAHTILHKELKQMFEQWEGVKKGLKDTYAEKWQSIIETLKISDRKLFVYISRKMLNHLCWIGIQEAKELLEHFGTVEKAKGIEDINRPVLKHPFEHIVRMSDEIFRIAGLKLKSEEIVSCLQKWIREDQSRFLVKVIENHGSPLKDLIDVITRYHYIEKRDIIFSPPVQKGLRVSLVRRFLSDDLSFINIAKNHIDIHDYFDLVQHIVYPTESRGKLGGKSAGLFLASKIIERNKAAHRFLDMIRVPKTWYLTSDGLTAFLNANNLDEVIEQKFKTREEIRVEYPNIIQIFKNSYFPPEIIKGLSTILQDLEDRPIIVRSSSLLEDRFGAVFSGKYKSLFLPNQGPKEKRLESLMDAIAEVYASTFSPDPIEYRSERGLLEFHEEMGVMIQEVVGSRIGHYYFPTFAGVAFSKNEFRWSPRINREDGLIRLVPGIGTRAVDRVADDYPVLIAPKQPNLRVNVSVDEICRYAPKKCDVINLKENKFETVEIETLFKAVGDQIPDFHRIISVCDDNNIKSPSSKLSIDLEKHNYIVTFEGFLKKTSIISQLDGLLDLLEDQINTPVDIEFAYDGENLHILQCRPQSHSRDHTGPSPIPSNIPNDDIVFTADRYISNGYVPDITYIVYVPAQAYGNISDLSVLSVIGGVVGRLNQELPKRQFILMGPGRWGSRGDIKLGVNVTYSDINNTAMLIEVAQKKGNYIPELSFGTHFFQDLVESNIRYLPLYPDEESIVFNSDFLDNADNTLCEWIPEASSMSETIRLIDVPAVTGGRILRVLLNADLERAIAYLTEPS